MHTSKAKIFATTAALALAGCSGGNSQMAPTLGPNGMARSIAREIAPNDHGMLASHRGVVTGHRAIGAGFFNPDAKGKPLIFVTDYFNNVVNIYLQARSHKMVGQITGFNEPSALTTDAARNLYVANFPSDPSNVLVYAPPYTKGPKLTLDDTGYSNTDISVSPLGVVAVANVLCIPPKCGSSGGPGSVTFYAKNATNPCATIVDSTNFAHVWDDAFDDKGNLYIDGYSAGSRFVTLGEIRGGCKAKKVELITAPASFQYAGGIKIDKADRLAIIDGGRGSVMDTYDPPKKGMLGNPISSISLAPLSNPDQLAFRASGKDVYVTDQASAVYEFSYPAGAVVGASITGHVAGVAVTPPLVP